MKKLIRNKMALQLNPNELDYCLDRKELIGLYTLKLKEEIEEIKNSNYQDIMEYADLIQVTLSLANLNGFKIEDVMKAIDDKYELKGGFTNLVLTNLNPNNPSNKIYLEN
jgi:predicted house-cleaning noncanonical NTP pyrophosphatase (MazG superfamily)